VSRFLNREPVVVPPGVDLQNSVEDYVYRSHRKMFPVASNGHVEGVIGTQALANYARQDGRSRGVYLLLAWSAL
jgi:hypothetical protein